MIDYIGSCKGPSTTYLELILEQVFFVGQLAIEAKDLLFLLGKRLRDYGQPPLCES